MVHRLVAEEKVVARQGGLVGGGDALAGNPAAEDVGELFA